MTNYKVNSDKFVGYEVGDIVSGDELNPKLNLDALVSSGVLSVVKENKNNKTSKTEDYPDKENVNNGENRPY